MLRAASFLLLVLSSLGAASTVTPCSHTQLAVYRLSLQTHWTRELFPKQYPEFRPPAQWSRLIGRTHDPKFRIFSLGSLASAALQVFAEKGATDGLEAQPQGFGGVLDSFAGDAILQGEGKSDAKIFLDNNHTRVSLVMRMVPSPDWFIGVDSLDLCDSDGNWIDVKTIQLDPLDAGTDNGFTFTSPNWPSDPQQPVTTITASDPDHPASSFFYPDVTRLPRIATLHLVKTRVYKLSKEFPQNVVPLVLTSEDLEEMSNQLTVNQQAPVKVEESTTSHPIIAIKKHKTTKQRTSQRRKSDRNPVILHGNARTSVLPPKRTVISPGRATIVHEKPGSVVYQSTGSSTYQQLHKVSGVHYYRPGKTTRVVQDGNPTRLHHHNRQASSQEGNLLKRQRIRAIRRRKLAAQRLSRNKTPVPEIVTEREFLTSDAVKCRVSQWSAWSTCSATCGTGDAVRKRTIITGKPPCPPLEEKTWCSGYTACNEKFFKWR